MKFEMANYMNIYLRFNETFWEEYEFFVYADERRGHFPVWQNLGATGFHVGMGWCSLHNCGPKPKSYSVFVAIGQHILMTTVTGEEARRFERESDDVILEEAMQVLYNLFGDDIPIAHDILPQFHAP